MTEQYYDFYGDLLVQVLGKGGRTASQYQRMFDHFSVGAPDREPDLVIEETTKRVDPEVVLGDPDDYYGWTGEEFVNRNGSDFMAVKPGWDHISVTPGFEPFYAIYPMEFEIRRRRVERDQALVHASGVTLDGQTTLFPAWRGGGKTNTLLSLLREGAGFLSDDRLWVGADRTAVGYPLGVNLQPHNIDSFEELDISHETLEDRIRHEVHEYIDERVGRTGSLPETAINYFNNAYLGDSSRDFTDVRSLYPSADYIQEATVDNVVFLQAAPDAGTVTAEQITTDEAMTSITSICNFEWDGRLREYFHAYDSLVGAGEMVATLDRVIERERAVFRQLFDDVSTYRAWVPRKRNWGDIGLDTAMADTVKSLQQRQMVEASD